MAANTIYYQNIGSATSPQFAAPKGYDLELPLGSGKRIGFQRIYNSAPTFADIDNDGDLDAFIGDWNGDTYFFQNTGSPSTPSFAAPQKNPFGLSKAGTTFLGANFRDSKPTFADIEGDGDLDAFIGDDTGNTNFFQNIGSATSPQFAAPQVNPFGLSKAGAADSAPTFADINNDGNLDAFIGNGYGDTLFFQNTAGLQFAGPQTNPFGLTPVEYGVPTFADIDNDGDLDAFIGGGNGNTYLFQNTGTASSPQFATFQTNPFGLTNVGSDNAPTFADIDNDGDLDAFIGDGQGQGNINYFKNTAPVGGTPPLSGAGGQQQFMIAAGDGTVNISNFGGVGPGVNPAAVIAQVDTLQFTGADLTPEKLLLTQQGDDLELSFEGVADTKVVLGNFALEDLDNLSQDTGAVVDLGNILFEGQTVIEDSFDVFNAEWQREQVFHRNSVTFLNDFDNNIKGFNRSQDVINGQGGNDRINGRSGDDLLRGGDGFDTLIGSKGDDTLVGCDGVDRLRGGKGDDLLDSGLGDDLFVLAANRGTDIVQDFTNGSDRFGLADGLTFGQLSIAQSRSNTLINITATNEVLASLTGVSANLIGAEDFTVA